MRRLIKYTLILTILGGIAAAVVVPAAAWFRKSSRPRYLTTSVTRGRIETSVNNTGTVKPVRTVSVGAVVSGPILKVRVDYNSKIKKGDLLAEIDPRLFLAAVKRDEASLRTAEALLRIQKSELARVQALLQQAKNNEQRARNLMKINADYLSGNELDQVLYARQSQEAQETLAKASIDQALAGIEQAKANLENSQSNLEFTKIESPVDGVVIERKVDDGQSVASAFQTPEMFIVAPDLEKRIHIFASVDEADIGQIRLAKEKESTVTFTVDAYPHDVFEGKIYQVRMNSTTTQNVVTYPVIVEAGNQELKLMPGMTASLTFPIDSKDNVLRIPTSALRYLPDLRQVHPDDRHYLEKVTAATVASTAEQAPKQSANQKAQAAKSRSKRLVWVREENLLRAVPVTLGISDTQYAELVTGDLREGMELVTGMAMIGPGGRP